MLPNLTIVPKKIRQQKSDGPAELRGMWQKVNTKSVGDSEQKQGLVLFPCAGLVSSNAIHNLT